MKVYVENSYREYERMFLSNGWEIATDVRDADLVQFVGGADVNPELYNEASHPFTRWSKHVDGNSIYLFTEAIKFNKPMAGICRGGQFLNVMCGGKMYQHVDGHATGMDHLATVVATGERIRVSSTHHQMMRPADNAKVLMVAHNSTRREWMEDGKVAWDNDPRFEDIEACFYDLYNGVLCYQPHPEMMTVASDCVKQYFAFIKEYLGLEA